MNNTKRSRNRTSGRWDQRGGLRGCEAMPGIIGGVFGVDCLDCVCVFSPNVSMNR
jgi:hypothetical protein